MAIPCPERALEARPPSIRLRMRPQIPLYLSLPCRTLTVSLLLFRGAATGIFLEKMPGAACQFRPRRNQPIPAGASVSLPCFSQSHQAFRREFR